jgi:hypothetical protein
MLVVADTCLRRPGMTPAGTVAGSTAGYHHEEEKHKKGLGQSECTGCLDVAASDTVCFLRPELRLLQL